MLCATGKKLSFFLSQIFTLSFSPSATSFRTFFTLPPKPRNNTGSHKPRAEPTTSRVTPDHARPSPIPFFEPPASVTVPKPIDNKPDHPVMIDDTHANFILFPPDDLNFTGYLSDQSDDFDEGEMGVEGAGLHPLANFGVIPPPPRKRQKLLVPI